MVKECQCLKPTGEEVKGEGQEDGGLPRGITSRWALGYPNGKEKKKKLHLPRGALFCQQRRHEKKPKNNNGNPAGKQNLQK